MNSYLCEHNVFERIRRLTVPGNRHQYAERLDKDVLEASLAAEQKVTRFGEPQWSVSLSKARKKAQAIQKQLSMIRTGIENHGLIQKEWSDAGGGETLPTSAHECSILRRRSRKEISEIVPQSFQQREQERQQLIELLKSSGKPSDTKGSLLSAGRLSKLCFVTFSMTPFLNPCIVSTGVAPKILRSGSAKAMCSEALSSLYSDHCFLLPSSLPLANTSMSTATKYV